MNGDETFFEEEEEEEGAESVESISSCVSEEEDLDLLILDKDGLSEGDELIEGGTADG